jgi:hypothetical protein
MQIVTKSKALAIQKANPGASRERFDRGKYATTPAEAVGREFTDRTGVLAVFPEARRDKDGPYTALFAIYSPNFI